MADLGFLPVVRRLLEATPAEGQRMLFSATLAGEVDVLARRFLTRPTRHDVDAAAPPAQITHHLLTVTPADRAAVVTVLASGEDRVLIAASAPRTVEFLDDVGFTPVVVDISEFEKLEGCVTCLSVLLPGR